MYADPLTVNIDQPTSQLTHDFVRISTPNGGRFVNVTYDISTGFNGYPGFIALQHQVVGKGAAVRDRHLVRFESVSDDGDGNYGTLLPLLAYTVFDIPRNGASRTAAAIKAAQTMSGFLRNAGQADDWDIDVLEKLYRGEI